MTRYYYVKVMPVYLTIPVLPLLAIAAGFFVLLWTTTPILTQLMWVKNSTNSSEIVSPVQAQEVAKLDLTKASNWFPQISNKKLVMPIDTYQLSIPKLRITKATVKIGSDDLSKSLIHYGSTALPGKMGNAVIFGHSILPQFYDPKNYLAIFSTLYTLKEDDDIFIHIDGVDYRYQVVRKQITSPEDITGLEQRYDKSYLILVTCFPSGTYAQRIWLTAELRSFGER